MRFLFALVLLSVAVSLAVPVVCLVAEFVGVLRKRRARRRSVEQADTDRTLTYLAALRATDLDPAPWQEDFVHAAFVAERTHRLLAEEQQREVDRVAGEETRLWSFRAPTSGGGS